VSTSPRPTRDGEISGDPAAEFISFSILGWRPDNPAESQKETRMFQNPPTPGSAGVVDRQLEKSVSWTRRERLRLLWYRFRLTVVEMNYASRRMIEL
jgi:hypothetical protein